MNSKQIRKLMSIVEESSKVDEGHLIPMPDNVMFLPVSDYEFYHVMQHLVNPGDHYQQMSQSPVIMIPQSDVEKKHIENGLTQAKIPFLELPNEKHAEDPGAKTQKMKFIKSLGKQMNAPGKQAPDAMRHVVDSTHTSSGSDITNR